MVFVPFLQRLAAQQIENAVVPTRELEVGSRFGAGASNFTVIPARELRVEGKFGGWRLPDHPGRPRAPGYTGGGYVWVSTGR